MTRIVLPLLFIAAMLLAACAGPRSVAVAPVPAPPIRVEVVEIPKSAELVAALKAKGINAVVFPKNDRIIGEQQNRVIWLGKQVPLETLRTTIDETLKVFPLMNFLYVIGDKGEQPPEDRNYTIHIGGSTEGALFMKLTVIPADEMKRVLAAAATIEDVHRYLHDWNRQETLIQ